MGCQCIDFIRCHLGHCCRFGGAKHVDDTISIGLECVRMVKAFELASDILGVRWMGFCIRLA